MQFNSETSRSVLFKEGSSGRAMTVQVLSRGTDALILQVATSLMSLVIDRFCERLSGFSTGSRRSQYCYEVDTDRNRYVLMLAGQPEEHLYGAAKA